MKIFRVLYVLFFKKEKSVSLTLFIPELRSFKLRDGRRQENKKQRSGILRIWSKPFTKELKCSGMVLVRGNLRWEDDTICLMVFRGTQFRCIQIPGVPYCCHWTIRVCGTWGQRYGQGGTWGKSCIWGCGTMKRASSLSMIRQPIYCFVARLSTSTSHF